MIHPDHLDELLTHRQLMDWQRYYACEPWGEERADLRMARQVWATLQPHSKKRLDEREYLFQFEPPREPTPEDYREKHMAAMRRWATMIPGEG